MKNHHLCFETFYHSSVTILSFSLLGILFILKKHVSTITHREGGMLRGSINHV